MASGHNDKQKHFLAYTTTGAEAQEWLSFVVLDFIVSLRLDYWAGSRPDRFYLLADFIFVYDQGYGGAGGFP